MDKMYSTYSSFIFVIAWVVLLVIDFNIKNKKTRVAYFIITFTIMIVMLLLPIANELW
jgi:hypothetical protein